jgi:hypothetical protein
MQSERISSSKIVSEVKDIKIRSKSRTFAGRITINNNKTKQYEKSGNHTQVDYHEFP